MSVRRFMIQSGVVNDGYALLGDELFRHVVRVLRMDAGDALVLVDESGNEHQGIVERVEKDRCFVRIEASREPADQMDGEPRLTICQALPKGEKTDLILQKGTELGVHDFRLFGGIRSVPRVRDDHRAAKLARWNRIVSEAARQCRRNSIPVVGWYPSAAEVTSGVSHDVRLLLWEEEQTMTLKSALSGFSPPGSIIVAIGPEGGFDIAEIRCFMDCGFIPVSLGGRILRTETAALAIAAIVQYIWQ